MIDLRDYKDTAKVAVAKEREDDENWSWSLKAVNKNEIRIGWGYLDYIGEKDPFKVEVNDEDDVLAVIGTIPNGRKVYAFVGPKHWHDYDTVEKAIAGVIHSMACSAHNTY